MNDRTEKKTEAQVTLTIKPVGKHSDVEQLWNSRDGGTTNNNVLC
ncbi:MAG: hypothetical protein ACOY94_25440 [Bacillota bacterium]